MASAEAVVDSGVDSEATTPSSPEDQESQEDENKAKQEDEDMVLETAETLLALSGKHLSFLWFVFSFLVLASDLVLNSLMMMKIEKQN